MGKRGLFKNLRRCLYLLLCVMTITTGIGMTSPSVVSAEEITTGPVMPTRYVFPKECTRCHKQAMYWTIVKQPSCKRDGEAVGICKNCSRQVKLKLQKTSHIFRTYDGCHKVCVNCGMHSEQHTKPVEIRRVLPTCTTSGYILYGCGRCHKQMEKRILAPEGHSFVMRDDGTWFCKRCKVVRVK